MGWLEVEWAAMPSGPQGFGQHFPPEHINILSFHRHLPCQVDYVAFHPGICARHQKWLLFIGLHDGSKACPHCPRCEMQGPFLRQLVILCCPRWACSGAVLRMHRGWTLHNPSMGGLLLHFQIKLTHLGGKLGAHWRCKLEPNWLGIFIHTPIRLACG